MLPTQQRASGVLAHPTSFPSRFGIGDLGPEAYCFIDFLQQAKQRVWQILPLGPTGTSNSPYAAYSSVAGNPLLISLDDLVGEGWLQGADIDHPLAVAPNFVDFERLGPLKIGLLRRAHEAFRHQSRLQPEFAAFCQEQADWLGEHALFMSLHDLHPGKEWYSWPRPLARREPAALEAVRLARPDLIEFHQFAQFLFFRQWTALKKYAHDREICIVGDIPFYVAYESVDVWSQPENFALDPETTAPRLMAGVPPDYFSATGQLWGNPVYDWEQLTRQGFAWWVQKFKRLMQLVDVIRVDHFRGFAAYWQVPQGETTAIKGEWAPGPGAELFRVLRQELGRLPVWAEDLGLISRDVEELRDGLAFPGMKVLQFAFDGLGPKNIHLPFHFPHNSVVYTGTHDNDTTLGWWHQLSPGDRHRVRVYLGKHDDHEIHWALIRLALSTVSHTAVFPLQDILGLGGEARMNRPGSPTGNWAWRYRAEELQGWMADRLRELTEMYGRAQPRE